MPSAATAGPDDAGDTPEHRARSGTKYATRRVERMVIKSPWLPNDRT